MKKQITVGIVGMGEHMLINGHIKHLLQMPDVVITRWFDPNNSIDLSCFSNLKKQPERSSFEEILNDDRIGAIFIGSPDKYHAEQLLSCVKAGKHVFCEKPMALTMDERDVLREALFIANQKGLIVSSCHPRRFDPPFVWIKQGLETGVWKDKIGKVTDFIFDFWYHEVTDKWKKDRSLLKDHFGHEIDLYRFLFGSEHPWEAVREFDGYDKYKVFGVSKDDDFPNFSFTGYRSLDEHVYQETVTIKGTKNAAVFQLNTGIGMWMKDGKQFNFPAIDYDARFRLINENFIKAVRGEEESYLTADDMLVNNISGIELCSEDEQFAYKC